jgi:molybdate transport system substrate-binding protein
MNRYPVLLLALALAIAGPVRPATAEDRPLLVFAAASLKTALEAASADYAVATGRSVTFSFAGSGALARQLEEGAPADAFVSADHKWMDYAVEKGIVDRASERVIAGNSLVLVAPAGSGAELDLMPGADLAGLLGADGRLAIGEPNAVPAGAYAVEALTKLGLLDAVQARFVPVENVRAALTLVSSGEAPAGIVYGTDAKADPKVEVVATFPEDSHAPIVYPAGVVAGSADKAAAAAFLDWLASDAGRSLLTAQGFSVPAP